MRTLPRWLSRRSRRQIIGLVGGLVALLGAIDFLTGSEISFSIFYLLPVAIATWWLGRSWGIASSLGSGLVWLAANLATRDTFSDLAIPAWNAAVRIGFFLLFVTVLRNLWEARAEASRLLADVQRRLIPTGLPTISGIDIATTWEPAQVVGGDYFDILRLSDHRVGICIADVSGKGLEAALVMSNLQAAVRVLAPGGLSPRKLCERLNELVCTNTGPGRFVSFLYAVLDVAGGTLVYTNAGHNPAVLAREGFGPLRLAPGGPVLGVLRGAGYAQESLAVAPGDRLTLFTDGLTEVTDREGEEFGEERLLDLLAAHRDLPARELQARILETVAAFHADAFTDDVTLVTLVVGERPAARRRLWRRRVA